MGIFDFFKRKDNSIETISIEYEVKTKELETIPNVKPSNSLDEGLGVGPFLKECGTVVLLDWCNNQTLNATYPNYFYHSYTITDPRRLHQDFIDRGLLVPPSAEQLYKMMTIVDLKELLKSNGLKLSGNKSALIERLAENNIPPAPSDRYVLSFEGERFLNEQQPWLDYHRIMNTSFNAREFKEEWDRQGVATYDSIAWELLYKKLDEAALSKQFGRYKSIMRDVFFYYERIKSISDAVRSAVVITCLELSGLEDDFERRLFAPQIFLSEHYIQFISRNIEHYDPALIKEIHDGLQLKYGVMNAGSMRYYIELAIEDMFKANIEISKLNEIERQKSYNKFLGGD